MSKEDEFFTAVIAKSSESEEIKSETIAQYNALSRRLKKFKVYYSIGGTATLGPAFALMMFVGNHLGWGFNVSMVRSVFGGVFGATLGALVANKFAKMSEANIKQESQSKLEEKIKAETDAVCYENSLKKEKDINQCVMKIESDPEKRKKIMRLFYELIKTEPFSDLLLSSPSTSMVNFPTDSSADPSTFSSGSLGAEIKKPNKFVRKVFARLEFKDIEVSPEDEKQIHRLGRKWDKFNNSVMSDIDIRAFASAVHHACMRGLNPEILRSIYATVKKLSSKDVSETVAAIVKARMTKMGEVETSGPQLDRLRLKERLRKNKFNSRLFDRTSKMQSNSGRNIKKSQEEEIFDPEQFRPDFRLFSTTSGTRPDSSHTSTPTSNFE